MYGPLLLAISFLNLSVSGASSLSPRGLEHPQTNVSLVYPEGPVQVGVGQDISLGVVDLQSGLGFRTDMIITLDHEDGSPDDHQEAPFTQACSAMGYHGPFTVGFHVNKTGRYHATWNFTYTYSSDTSKAAADPTVPCGPGPYSSESVILGNVSIDVIDKQSTIRPPDVATVSTQLPMTPTGFLYATTGASTSTARSLYPGGISIAYMSIFSISMSVGVVIGVI